MLLQTPAVPLQLMSDCFSTASSALLLLVRLTVCPYHHSLLCVIMSVWFLLLLVTTYFVHQNRLHWYGMCTHATNVTWLQHECANMNWRFEAICMFSWRRDSLMLVAFHHSRTGNVNDMETDLTLFSQTLSCHFKWCYENWAKFCLFSDFFQVTH